jgi:hypothetical protein
MRIKCSGHIVRVGEKGEDSKILSEELKQRNIVVDMRMILKCTLREECVMLWSPVQLNEDGVRL